jgi:hypothetical protein
MKYISITALAFLLLFTGCNKRYWYRQKISLSISKPKPYKGTVWVEFSNKTVEHLNGNYEQPILNSAYKEFKRIGLTKKESSEADYKFKINLYLDSSITGRPSPYSISSTRFYKNKALNLEYEFVHIKTGKIIRRFNEDIYFFDDTYRDIGRCAHMVRYAVKALRDDK